MNPGAAGKTYGAERSMTRLVILGIAALIALCSYGYWKLIYWPTTPQYALGQFFDAARVKDYNRVYDLVEVPPSLRLFIHNGHELQTVAERIPGLIPEVVDYRFGHASVTGDHARVETTTIGRFRRRGFSITFDVEMQRRNGIWRIDGKWLLAQINMRGFGGVLLNGGVGD